MNEVLIKLENANKTINGKRLFSNISLELKKGDVYYLIGKSGTGKSTFLKALVGLVEFSSGEISYFSSLNNNLSIPEVRSRIHYLGQFIPAKI